MENNELNYNERVEVLELIKNEIHEHWKTILDIDNKFKQDDPTMVGEKRTYWVNEQFRAYERKQVLDSIKVKLTMSL